MQIMGKKIFLAFSFLILSAASLYCFWVVTAYALAPSNDYVGVAQNGFSEPFLSEYYKNPQDDEVVASSKASSVGEVTVAANNVAKGKIINKSIDSSAANLRYNKIYVKNNYWQTPLIVV